jgi:hypothetical protein
MQLADYKTMCLTTVLALVSAFSYPYPQKSARGEAKPNKNQSPVGQTKRAMEVGVSLEMREQTVPCEDS